MNLGDKPCYPTVERAGITFRERLIIALASNPNITRSGYKMDSKTESLKPDTEDLFNYADAIIKELEKL